MTVKKKWCRLHGRCPHEIENWLRCTAVDFETEAITYEHVLEAHCLRCDPPQELTEGARRRAMMRGFKLPKRIRTKEFIQRFNIRS